jgi:hypothetical protein
MKRPSASPNEGGFLSDLVKIRAVAAVVLRGPANTEPESIVGPFPTMEEAEGWAQAHPRQGGYCVAQALSAPDAVELNHPR